MTPFTGRENSGFEAYCLGPIFANDPKNQTEIERWRRAAMAWNSSGTDEPRYNIDDPPIEVHLLDPDDWERDYVKLPRWPHPPPEPPAPVPAKLKPPLAAPGIGKALRQPIKKKGLSH